MFNSKNPIAVGVLTGIASFVVLFLMIALIPGMKLTLAAMLGISLASGFLSYRGARKKLQNEQDKGRP